MAQVSVKDIMAVVRTVEHYKGKHIKELLSSLEERGSLDPDMRKLILDHFNGFARSVLIRLGYTVEQ